MQIQEPSLKKPGPKTATLTIMNKLKGREDASERLRTRSVTGTFNYLPGAGTTFIMIAEALDTKMKMRYIETSIVKKITKKEFAPTVATYWFITQNTEYKLEVER